MVNTYGGEALFAGGPTRFRAGGVGLRFAEQGTLGGRGRRLIRQGREGRRIEQWGTLVADTLEELRAQMLRIEARADGVARELVDDANRRWTGAVMLRFEPGRVLRLGPRWKVDYQVEYAVEA